MNSSKALLLFISSVLAIACGGCGGDDGEDNLSPLAVDDQVRAVEAVPVTINVLANDRDPEGGHLLITSFTPPANGTVVDNRDGTLTYTSNANLTFTDTDTFTYTVSNDRGASATATVTVTVLAALKLVSVAADGTAGNGNSCCHSLSADGRYVAFESGATNLVPGDTNNAGGIFMHDRQTGATTRVSVAADGSAGNNFSYTPSLSADGRYVAFGSEATNLVPGDTNNAGDIFVHDRQTGATTRVSVAADGSEGNKFSYTPSLSADGRYVAFESEATNLVPEDTNNAVDLFMHDRQTGATTCVSDVADARPPRYPFFYPSLSADGRYVAFDSYVTNPVPGDTEYSLDIFMHDRQTGATTRVSVASDGSAGNNSSYFSSLSADGRYVAFASRATNLVPGDTNNAADIFVHDRQTGATTRVSVASDGSEGNSDSYTPSLSADGRYVAFESRAKNLVPGDTNNIKKGVFVHDRQTGATTRVSDVADAGHYPFSYPSLSADGRYVAFRSEGFNIFVAPNP